MVTDDGTKIALSRIGFLLVSDQSDAFSVVCNDGEVIYQVASVSFAQGEPTGISSVSTEVQQTLKLNVASSSLQLRGCQSGTDITIYDVSGKTVRQEVLPSDGTISIVGLPAGIYVLKTGSASVKFLKK
jgi:hypothetical protein